MSSSSFGDAPVSSVVQPCPRKPEHWVGVTLQDEAGNPVPDALYRVTLPSGQVVSGYTDAEGKVRLEGLEAGGNCKVEFPEFDRSTWEPEAGAA